MNINNVWFDVIYILKQSMNEILVTNNSKENGHLNLIYLHGLNNGKIKF